MDPLLGSGVGSTIESAKAEYVEYKLDPDEYRRLGAGPNDHYEYNE